MTTFDKRKDEAETRFKHEEELKFKATARRNKLFGLWVAEQIGLTGDSAESYAREVVVADFDRPGDDDVVEKVMKDLADNAVDIPENRLRKEMDRFMAIAREQVQSE
ncbi:MAG: DUF1476 domain-containing protein [Alphaproteobacteria bacterium]